ncbi:hypothetical protein QQF64_034568 [Cirrhinus molitorella]|uniref:Uncharacterized protein n=1 Tax=Cirrhinus molitorella TaxID=172907 RepID=A0ABR3L126_9TELE
MPNLAETRHDRVIAPRPKHRRHPETFPLRLWQQREERGPVPGRTRMFSLRPNRIKNKTSSGEPGAPGYKMTCQFNGAAASIISTNHQYSSPSVLDGDPPARLRRMESYRRKQTGPSLGLDWEADQEESNLIRGESLLQSSFTCWWSRKAVFGLSVKGLRPAEGGGYANESVARAMRRWCVAEAKSQQDDGGGTGSGRHLQLKTSVCAKQMARQAGKAGRFRRKACALPTPTTRRTSSPPNARGNSATVKPKIAFGSGDESGSQGITGGPGICSGGRQYIPVTVRNWDTPRRATAKKVFGISKNIRREITSERWDLVRYDLISSCDHMTGRREQVQRAEPVPEPLIILTSRLLSAEHIDHSPSYFQPL